ncbi:MAG TPA: hypothetical protein VFG54_04925 [Prolixibacteraceae bacterium]|nr:hypothetical protein [Prolixibacteraceae bacterium]
MEWYKIVGLVIILLLFQFINNLYKYLRIKYLYEIYLKCLVTSNVEFLQKTEEVKSLFKEAGLKDFVFIHQESLGFGHYSNMTVSGFDNMTLNRLDVVTHMQTTFNKAIGVYRKRFTDSYNPMFWIDFIIKLPKYLLGYFGVLPEKIIVKIFNVIYWLLALAFGIKQTDIIENLLK